MSDATYLLNQKLFEEAAIMRKDIRNRIHIRCGNNRKAPYVDTQTRSVKNLENSTQSETS